MNVLHAVNTSAYGCWVMGTLLYGEVLDKNLLNAIFYNAATGNEVKADYFIVLQYLMMRHFEIVGVLLLMSVMSVFLGIFLVFHLYITACNMTTNEFFKWRAVKKFYKKEKTRYQQALKDRKVDTKVKSGSAKAALLDHTSDTDVGCTGSVGNTTLKDGEDNGENIFDPGLLPKNIYK